MNQLPLIVLTGLIFPGYILEKKKEISILFM